VTVRQRPVFERLAANEVARVDIFPGRDGGKTTDGGAGNEACLPDPADRITAVP
jgi:hypothetical protein